MSQNQEVSILWTSLNSLMALPSPGVGQIDCPACWSLGSNSGACLLMDELWKRFLSWVLNIFVGRGRCMTAEKLLTIECFSVTPKSLSWILKSMWWTGLQMRQARALRAALKLTWSPKCALAPPLKLGIKRSVQTKKPPQSLERLMPKRSPSPGLVCTIYGADAGILQVFMQMWCG